MSQKDKLRHVKDIMELISIKEKEHEDQMKFCDNHNMELESIKHGQIAETLSKLRQQIRFKYLFSTPH